MKYNEVQLFLKSTKKYKEVQLVFKSTKKYNNDRRSKQYGKPILNIIWKNL